MRINLLLKITTVALVLLGLSLRSAVSAGGSDEEVFPPKTLEKLKKNYSTQQKKTKSDTNTEDKNKVTNSSAEATKKTASTKSNVSSSGASQSNGKKGQSNGDVLEDEPLIADLTSIIDKDGIGEVNVVWKISNDGVTYRNIEIINNEFNKPEINLVGESKKILARLKKKNSKVVVSISISHEKSYALSVASILIY